MVEGRNVPVALVTGASRGIGRATAVALARAGHDVIITARTAVNETGEVREHSPTVKKSDVRPVPGSLQGTARLVEETGRRALVLPADLLDRAALKSVVESALDIWGGVDVLVNNARFTGPGHMDGFLDTTMEYVDKTMEANYVAPLVLLQGLLPGMLARGTGRILNVTSGAAWREPIAAPGTGWCSSNYAASKAALLRVAPYLAIEYAETGVMAFNVDPGLVVSERVAMETGDFGVNLDLGAPPESIAEAIVWLAQSPTAGRFNGKLVDAQRLCHDQRLLPGWSGPQAFVVSKTDGSAVGFAT